MLPSNPFHTQKPKRRALVTTSSTDYAPPPHCHAQKPKRRWRGEVPAGTWLVADNLSDDHDPLFFEETLVPVAAGLRGRVRGGYGGVGVSLVAQRRAWGGRGVQGCRSLFSRRCRLLLCR